LHEFRAPIAFLGLKKGMGGGELHILNKFKLQMKNYIFVNAGGATDSTPPPSDSLVSHLKGIYTLHKHFEKIYLEAYWGN